MLEPHTQDQSASYVTKVFFIRYSDEVVMIRDIVKFRTEVDYKPWYLQTDFFLKCELYYCAPPQANFMAAVNSAMIMKDELNKSANKFVLA